jgi:hypothetical protein
VDLVALLAVLRQAGRLVPGPALLEAYRDATAAHGARWTTGRLRTALTAYRAATGLTTLNGLA